MLDPIAIETKVPHYAEMLQKRHQNMDWREHLAKTAEMMEDLGQSPRLGKKEYAQLNCPVRLGIGDRDKMVTLEETLAAYNSIPASEFTVLPNTPHPIEKIDLEALAFSVQNFFGESL